jgi:hypothetical protein
MTTVQITLPDQLAEEAERAGLLSSESIEELLRKQLKAKAAGDLIALLNKLDAAESGDYISPEDVAEEIRVMRAEKRASQGAFSGQPPLRRSRSAPASRFLRNWQRFFLAPSSKVLSQFLCVSPIPRVNSESRFSVCELSEHVALVA